MGKHFPQSATGLSYLTLPAGPTASANPLTAAGSAHTKGAYVEFTSSLAFTCNSIRVIGTKGSTSGQNLLIDVATGAGGAEVVRIPNLLGETMNSTENNCPHQFELPLEVAAGTRVAARLQASAASIFLSVALIFVAAGDTPGVQTFTTYGANTGGSNGTSMDPGAVVDTKGSYAQITSSTSAVHQVLTISFLRVGAGTVSMRWAIDIATGAGGAEVVMIPDFRSSYPSYSATYIGLWPNAFTFLVYVPAGTRIAARCATNINAAAANARALECAITAAAAPAEEGGLMRHPGNAGGMAA